MEDKKTTYSEKHKRYYEKNKSPIPKTRGRKPKKPNKVIITEKGNCLEVYDNYIKLTTASMMKGGRVKAELPEGT